MKRGKRDRLLRCEKNILRSAEILCRTAYKMCRRLYEENAGDCLPDAKGLKESCAAVKEAASLISGLDKNKESADVVRVVFEDTGEYGE